MGRIIEFKPQGNIEGNQNKRSALIRFVNFMRSEKYKFLKNLTTTDFSFKQDLEIVKKYTDEELMNWLEDYSENDWRRRPSFFRAVSSELLERLRPHFDAVKNKREEESKNK